MQVNIHDAKTHLSRLLERAAHGEEVIIAKAGKPVARIVAIKEVKAPRKPGGMKGEIVIHDDFDDDLPEEMAVAFRGERP